MAGKLGVIEEEIIGKAVDRMSTAAAHVVADAKAEIESRRAAFLHTIEQAKFATVRTRSRPPQRLSRSARTDDEHGPRQAGSRRTALYACQSPRLPR
jgi:hypothetical protein